MPPHLTSQAQPATCEERDREAGCHGPGVLVSRGPLRPRSGMVLAKAGISLHICPLCSETRVFGFSSELPMPWAPAEVSPCRGPCWSPYSEIAAPNPGQVSQRQSLRERLQE